MKPWHPPEYVTLSLEAFTGRRRRKERLRFWGGVVGGVVLSCVVSWVLVGVALTVLP